MVGLRVLVVEDAPEIAEMLAVLLRAAGHHPTTAADGEEALALLRREPFDALLTDRAIPGMTGDELAVAAKRLHPGLPIVMLTGYGAGMRHAGEVPPDVDAVLAKPVGLAALERILAAVAGG